MFEDESDVPDPELEEISFENTIDIRFDRNSSIMNV